MESKEKNDLLNILIKTKKAISKNDIEQLKELSNMTIHSASIEQEGHHITIAVLIYSLSKILGREKYSRFKTFDTFNDKCFQNLGLTIEALKENNLKEFEKQLSNLVKNLTQIEPKLKKYIKDVIHKARINKASRIVEHGISIGQTAELLGLNYYELLDYIGRTWIADVKETITLSETERLNNARKLKTVVFDSSSIITLAMNNLLWVLIELKKTYNAKFLIPHSVKREIIDRPLQSRKFKLEAMEVSRLIDNKTIEVAEPINVNKILNLVNTTFKAKGHNIRILHRGEIEALALAIQSKADAFAVDERTMRVTLENPGRLERLLEHKLHTDVKVVKHHLKDLKKLDNVNIIRSSELVLLAFEKGMFKHLKYSNKEIIEALLWGLRLRGCSISTKEIEEAIRIENK